MSELTQIEREAKVVRDLITELKGLTPRFNATKERAEEELTLHLAKIDAERARLRELIDGAALIVQRLGLEEPVEAEQVAEVEQVEQAPEPVVAVADSPQADGWSAMDHYNADEALVAEVLAQAPAEEVVAAADGAQTDETEVAASAWLEDQFEAIDAGTLTEEELLADSPADEPAEEGAELPETFQTIGQIAAEVTAAVEQIADTPPATEDATDAPEMTNDQAERAEELLAEAPPVQTEQPESMLAKAGFFLNRAFA
jgi:hypothetical protein